MDGWEIALLVGVGANLALSLLLLLILCVQERSNRDE